jgi:hypothetical protein
MRVMAFGVSRTLDRSIDRLRRLLKLLQHECAGSVAPTPTLVEAIDLCRSGAQQHHVSRPPITRLQHRTFRCQEAPPADPNRRPIRPSGTQRIRHPMAFATAALLNISRPADHRSEWHHRTSHNRLVSVPRMLLRMSQSRPQTIPRLRCKQQCEQQHLTENEPGQRRGRITALRKCSAFLPPIISPIFASHCP